MSSTVRPFWSLGGPALHTKIASCLAQTYLCCFELWTFSIYCIIRVLCMSTTSTCPTKIQYTSDTRYKANAFVFSCKPCICLSVQVRLSRKLHEPYIYLVSDVYCNYAYILCRKFSATIIIASACPKMRSILLFINTCTCFMRTWFFMYIHCRCSSSANMYMYII